MSFVLILITVIIVLIILSIVFAALKFLFALLPLAIVVAGIIWLVYYLSNKSRSNSNPSPKVNRRGKPKNVSVEDIDDKRK